MLNSTLDRSQRILLLLMVGVSVVLLVLASWAGSAVAYGLSTVAAFMTVYVCAVLISQLPAELGGTRGRAWIREHVSDLGAGFYGVMGLASFLMLEVVTLLEDLGGPTPIRSFVSELGLHWLIGFSIESFKNFILALIWPAHLTGALGIGGASLVAGTCWGLLWWASRVLPAECLACEEEAEQHTDQVGA